MHLHLVKKLYSRYRKHLVENTLNIFWSELSRRDFRDHSIKEKTKKIVSLKSQLRSYHQSKVRAQENRGCRNLETLMDKLAIDPLIAAQIQADKKTYIDYEDYDDSFYQDKFIDLKNRLILYNDSLESELTFMEKIGQRKNLWPINALRAYIKVLESKNVHSVILQELVNPLIAGYADKIFINQNHQNSEPDIIAKKYNNYDYYESVLFKIGPWQVFDPALISQWQLKYGSEIKIIVIDFQIVGPKPVVPFTVVPFTIVPFAVVPFEIWNRLDLIEICVKGELGFGENYHYYPFDSPEYFEVCHPIQ